ncbi:MAG: endonuclease/exonuclease/phosphatase family protein [Thiomonas sp.]|uniref:Putative Endonuclease/Exonuclease/phosphatase n=1 Tax=mine drainage metagenome TaxID=410659 RepID=E6PW11_9ZZZZ
MKMPDRRQQKAARLRAALTAAGGPAAALASHAATSARGPGDASETRVEPSAAVPAPTVADVLRVASYNIHKGVVGLGPTKRLSIHELQEGLRELDADLVFLQEVQFTHPRHARRFSHWPELPQHEVLGRGLGMHTAYHTNATTRHGEHGNALLTRLPILSVAHHDVSDHRFEQRGLLHVRLQCAGLGAWHGGSSAVGGGSAVLHAIVVHFGLFSAGRKRQIARLVHYIAAQVPGDESVIVAGDFNDWRGQLGTELAAVGLIDVSARQSPHADGRKPRWRHRVRTFPARLPLMPLDRIYARGYAARSLGLGWGAGWARLSDHAPLLVDLEPATTAVAGAAPLASSGLGVGVRG